MAVGVHRQADLAVAERLHHNSWVNALDEQQRRACMTKVVETHRWQVGPLEEFVEPVRDVWSVGERSTLAWEHQVEVDPAFSSCEALNGLATPMCAERVDDGRRHDQGSPASLGFCLDELRALMWDSLRCSANSKHAGFEIDVGPVEPKRLALTKAKGQSDRR